MLVRTELILCDFILKFLNNHWPLLWCHWKSTQHGEFMMTMVVGNKWKVVRCFTGTCMAHCFDQVLPCRWWVFWFWSLRPFLAEYILIRCRNKLNIIIILLLRRLIHCFIRVSRSLKVSNNKSWLYWLMMLKIPVRSYRVKGPLSLVDFWWWMFMWIYSHTHFVSQSFRNLIVRLVMFSCIIQSILRVWLEIIFLFINGEFLFRKLLRLWLWLKAFQDWRFLCLRWGVFLKWMVFPLLTVRWISGGWFLTRRLSISEILFVVRINWIKVGVPHFLPLNLTFWPFWWFGFIFIRHKWPLRWSTWRLFWGRSFCTRSLVIFLIWGRRAHLRTTMNLMDWLPNTLTQ